MEQPTVIWGRFGPHSASPSSLETSKQRLMYQRLENLHHARMYSIADTLRPYSGLRVVSDTNTSLYLFALRSTLERAGEPSCNSHGSESTLALARSISAYLGYCMRANVEP